MVFAKQHAWGIDGTSRHVELSGFVPAYGLNLTALFGRLRFLSQSGTAAVTLCVRGANAQDGSSGLSSWVDFAAHQTADWSGTLDASGSLAGKSFMQFGLAVKNAGEVEVVPEIQLKQA